MRFVASMVVFVIVGSIAQSGGAQKDKGKKDQDKIQGTWEVVEFIANGRSVPDEVRSKIKVVIKDDKMEITGTGGLDKREYVFKLDPKKNPKEIDAILQFEPFKGKTSHAIYDLDGDKLKLCMPNTPTTERPTEFKAPTGSKLGLLVLKRTKS